MTIIRGALKSLELTPGTRASSPSDFFRGSMPRDSYASRAWSILSAIWSDSKMTSKPSTGDRESRVEQTRGDARLQESGAGRACSILSVISGLIAFLFPIFALAAFGFGVFGVALPNSRGWKILGFVGIVLSVIGGIAGVILSVFTEILMRQWIFGV